MHYYIDGYNYLFCTEGVASNLHLQRTEFLKRLRTCALALNLTVTIVFDSATQIEATRGHLAPLECVYTSQYQTADAYILSLIQCSRLPAQITLVTSDKPLAASARSYGAHTIEVIPFLNWLSGRYAKVQHKERMPLVKMATKKVPPKTHVPSIQSTASSLQENLCTIFEQRYRALCEETSATQPRRTHKAPERKSLPRSPPKKTDALPKSTLESENSRWQRLFEQKAKEIQEEW